MILPSFAFLLLLIEQVNVQFSGNRAVLASNLYMSRLDKLVCSTTFSYTTKFVESRNTNVDIIDWPIWDFG